MLIPFNEAKSGLAVYVNHLNVTHVEGLLRSDGSKIYVVGRKEPIQIEENVCDAAGLLDVDSDEEEDSI